MLLSSPSPGRLKGQVHGQLIQKTAEGFGDGIKPSGTPKSFLPRLGQEIPWFSVGASSNMRQTLLMIGKSVTVIGYLYAL